MSKDKHRIIIKRSGRAKHAHHGGGWKIAYADFMTAMMAFFLVMWLLSISNPKELEGISEYFRMPLKVALVGGNKSSLSSSVIPGGGHDPMHTDGEVRRVNADASDMLDSEDRERLSELKKKLEELIEINPFLKRFKAQLLIDITSEGLRIQIVDTKKRPMFDLSSARVAPYMRDILREIGPILNELPNKIALSGHTDATPYSTGEKLYSNWELSADRANASRRELVAGGMEENKVLRVRGAASTMHMNQDDPYDAVNRRISLVVLNRAAEAQIQYENQNNGNDKARTPPSQQMNGNMVANIQADNPKVVANQFRANLPKVNTDGGNVQGAIRPVSSQRTLKFGF
ncbi:flagellar motor protein MotB [Glaciimonas sp. GS1]|uniref:Flagellar motor protein MotB n=2 Tax=Glaciimonas soli TaxID=2590999 RepID=A0A843YQB9_9BURK|nr:flagellar motor protein MotB [Glaciimonas soli]